jgi:hypothetical protein
MTPSFVLQRAADLGIRHTPEVTSSALVRRIQTRLGQDPCCGTEARYTCRSSDCLWLGVCQRLATDWRR